jgi:serine/threonine-protein kinase
MKPYLKIGALVGAIGSVIAVVAYVTLRLIVTSEDVVVVPDLIGKDVVYTLELLTDLGLNTKVSSHEYSAEIPKNHVTFQQPDPGAEIKKDRDVRIVVSKGPETVTVPDLAGMDIHEAKIILEDNGLMHGVLSQTYDVSAPGEQVMGQFPTPGTVVKRGTAIDVLTSLGDRPVELMMPHLKGSSMRDAVLLLERSQLSLGQLEYVEETELPQDMVIAHTPQAGFPVTAGSLINLTVNRGKQKPLTRERAFHVLSYPVSPGLLKRHVRFRVNAFGLVYDLMDVFAEPGQRLQVLLPGGEQTRFFLYEDDDLVWAHSFSSGSPAIPPVTVLENQPFIKDFIFSEDHI